MTPMATGHSAPRTVDDYLRQLRAALEGATPALIQDALADAEDYLREEVSLGSYKPESEILARVVRSFGTPQEVAAEYRAVETRFERRHVRAERTRGKGFFSIAFDPQAYGGLLYALLALPIGIAYFTWVVTGVSLSAGLAVLIIGVPFTLLFIASCRLIALLEGRIVETLLGKRMPRRLPTEERRITGVWPRIRAMLTDARTWSTMFYMVLQLPLGVAYFVIAVVGLTLSVGLVTGPFIEAIVGRNVIFLSPAIDRFADTPLGMGVMMVVGFLLFFVLLHLMKALSGLHARYAEATLVRI
ncbi:MAG: sensor domain-containing protein [Alphaproteobacteria bacterium]|nr:sensor domain-containing protein [Alphaproteobacteria bacterium]